MKIVLGLSGGLDSATLLAYFLEQRFQVHCCIFAYASKHNNYELASAGKIVAHYKELGFPITFQIIDVPALAAMKSDLLVSGGKIPEGHYQSESMKSTVVPGRNLIFASILAGIAESLQYTHIALGVHAGDHHIYPDCRPEFISALNTTIEASTNGTVRVLAPFIFLTKGDIVAKGIFLQVPYELTRTCYKNQGVSCGKCGSCVERLEAFAENGISDPIPYE